MRLRMVFWLLLVAALLMSTLTIVPTTAQDSPTLVPPTLALQSPTATPYPPITQSAIARIQDRQPPTLIVGLPYNNRPFSSINAQGQIEGFEADFARAIANDWGVPIEFRQTTKHNAYDLLQSGAVDLLMGQQIISRDAPAFLDFSTPIFVGGQVALAMADAPQNSITELSGQAVGVVVGSRGEEAFMQWSAAAGVQSNLIRYAMLDDGLGALGARQIVALVGDRWELDQRVRVGGIQGVKLLDGFFRTEPYAIAMLRYDESLRSLVNRTLQRLVKNDLINPMYDVWFPEGLLDRSARVIPLVWKEIDADTRLLQDFARDVVRPSRSVIEKIKAGEPIIVAGLGIPPDARGQPSLLERLNSALLYEMARRWNAQVGVLPNSYTNPEDILAAGGADLAVGIEPRWSTVDRVDYVGMYAERGYRMFVRIGSSVESFADLRTGNRTIGTFSDDPAAFEVAKRLALSVGLNEATIRSARYNDDNEAVLAVFDNNVRLVFGDALRIVPLAQANANRVQLTPRLYDGRPIGFAVPRNDVEFRMLIEATLQEMWRDGTYQRIFQEQWNLGEPLKQIVYPGTLTPFGIKITQ
ncbi:MAG: hypothetical protein OHK0023_08230 [Anaerolineae bacterium]